MCRPVVYQHIEDVMLTFVLFSAGQEQPSQSTAAEAEQEADDMPPIQNTLDSQTAPEEAAAAGAGPGSALAPAPAGPASSTPQLPQQSLVEKLNEAAEEEPVFTKAVGTEDGSIAFVTEPGLAEGIQTSADAAAASAGLEAAIDPAGTAGMQSPAGTAGMHSSADRAAELDRAGGESPADKHVAQPSAKRRSSRAEGLVRESSVKRSSSRLSAEKKKKGSGDKENTKGPPAEEASHMAEKEPHSRVAEAKGVTPSQVLTGGKKKTGEQGKRDALIGRCIKKDFETDDGLKTYTGWIIGKHESKNW